MHKAPWEFLDEQLTGEAKAWFTDALAWYVRVSQKWTSAKGQPRLGVYT